MSPVAAVTYIDLIVMSPSCNCDLIVMSPVVTVTYMSPIWNIDLFVTSSSYNCDLVEICHQL